MRTHSRARLAIGTAGATVLLVTAFFVAFAATGTAARQVAPQNQTPPTISGTASEGSTLTADRGEWTGSEPISYSYSWRRCDQNGGSCSAISGATQRTYTLKPVDNGNTLRVRVTARNADGTEGATSVPTAVVRAAPTPPAPAPTGCPSGSGAIAADQLAPPARLSIDRQELSPSVVGRSTSTLTARFHVSACGGRPVQGALLYVTAVPYRQFSIAPEQATGADGWGTLNMGRQQGFPASRSQQLLVMFVRARKSGENPLGGVSTRRLVSFPVNLSR
jgi:hypothetical protein